MVDATTGHEALSFMDGSLGYNQIRMAPKDEELTTFRTSEWCLLDKRMQMQHINVPCGESLMTCSIRMLSAMLTMWWWSLGKETTTYEISTWCFID